METIKPKRSLVEETYDILIDAICSGELAAGEWLHQDEIAARLNVSRQPVNSAISILKTNGLVVDTGRRSVVVAAFDPDLFRAIYDYRRVIEPFAVRGAGQRITDKDRAQADKVIAAGYRAIKRGNLVGLISADMQFHEMIYAWCGNPVVEMSMKTNWHHIRRSMGERLRDLQVAQPVWDEHVTIIDHLFAGRVEEAAVAMEGHISSAYQALDTATGPDTA